MSVEHTFGSPLLPTGLRKVTDTGNGVRLHVDTEDHDLGLLRSLAEAVRADDEVVDHLKQYAEVYNRLDEIERQNPNHAERQALLDEAADLRVEIDRAMDWQPVGEGQVVAVSPQDTETLATALVYVVARQIQNEPEGVVRDLHLARQSTGGAA